MSFVLDASVTAAWCFPDERTDYTEAVLEAVASATEAHVPTLWKYEVNNVVLKGLRRDRIVLSQAQRFLNAISRLRIRLTETQYDSTLATALQYSLTFYDAAYLDLARREGLALASLDGQLREAARQAGVPLYRENG